MTDAGNLLEMPWIEKVSLTKNKNSKLKDKNETTFFYVKGTRVYIFDEQLNYDIRKAKAFNIRGIKWQNNFV